MNFFFFFFCIHKIRISIAPKITLPTSMYRSCADRIAYILLHVNIKPS